MTEPDLAKYLGAGVLVVDTKTSSLLLVYDYTQNYNCCGGFIKYTLDDPERVVKTAKEELYEETRTLISCEIDRLKTLPFVDLNFYNDFFRCYILKMECEADICQQFENFNVGELPSEGEDYLETTALKFFPIKQFRKRKTLAKIVETATAKSRDARVQPLNRRVVSVIQAAVKANLL